MKQLLSVVIILLGTTLAAPAATLSDVKILEATGNIKYLTQKIAKDYLYLYTYPNKKEIYTTILDNVKSLEENIKTIAITTKDEKIKYILDFFAYEKEQIKLTLQEKIDKENANKVLDFSEALTEGAENIANSIHYSFTFEEKMFMRSKHIEYLVEKLAKYYMVLGSDIDKTTIPEKVQDTVNITQKDIDMIKQYVYPANLNNKKRDLLQYWQSNKHYYATIKQMKIPSIVLLSTQGLQEIVNQIAIHHSKGE